MQSDSAQTAPAPSGAAPPPATTSAKDRPRPLEPLGGAYVDASAVPLSWRGVPGASGYQVQIASTPAFDQEVVEVEAGRTTSLTLYSTLPARDVELFWRVRVDAPEAQWSGYGRFVATTDDAVEAYRSEQDAVRAERSKETARQREAREADLDLIPHYARDESVTSAGEAATLLFMLLSFALTIWLLFALT